jgi:hypothetical protein
MQKLFDRMGTEQHKYRLALQFTSIFIGSHGYVPQGTCYRIVLQRGSKKYSSNYLNVALNCEQPINETIQVKATMFFETARQQYQEKKVRLSFYVVRYSHHAQRHSRRDHNS